MWKRLQGSNQVPVPIQEIRGTACGVKEEWRGRKDGSLEGSTEQAPVVLGEDAVRAREPPSSRRLESRGWCCA